MAFQSLYRKHRPQAFSELVGQESVATALRNAVREGRIGHAYLFSGPRGTGKTSSARLLAKSLNCRDRRPDGEPCNACSSCTEIAAGMSMDVMELDAASNRGVSEMRALLERVPYRSAGGAMKVYIVDEVHMLTKEASTALLKTLEEPPEHVIFVLATTDPQMVLPTIRSRTQHFEFSLLSAEQLAAHLADVAAREGVGADSEALGVIARRAGGSARDALSLLDQALAYGEGKLVVDQVQTLLGGTPFASRAGVVDAIGSGDVAHLLERLDGLLGSGVDARALADDLLRHLRDVFLLASAGGRVRVEVPEEERARLQAQGEALGAGLIVRALEALGEAAMEIRRAPDPRLVLEVVLVRLARQESGAGIGGGSVDAAALAARVVRLERTVDELRRALVGGYVPAPQPAPAPPAGAPAESSGGVARTGPKAALGALRARGGGGEPKPPPPAATAPSPAAVPAAPATPAPVPAAPAATPSAATPPAATPPAAAAPAPGEGPTLDEVAGAWARTLAGCKPRLKAVATEASLVRVEGDKVVLGVATRLQQFHFPTLRTESAALAAVLSGELGRTVRLEVVLDDSLGEAAAIPSGGGDSDEHVMEPADPQGASEGGGVDSPVGLVIRTFGATVESETVRE